MLNDDLRPIAAISVEFSKVGFQVESGRGLARFNYAARSRFRTDVLGHTGHQKPLGVEWLVVEAL